MTFDQPMIMGYDPSGSSSSYTTPSSASGAVVKKKKSIKSETSIDLRGPLEVDGSVKSMASIKFDGDFAVRDRVEAYGDVGVHGTLNCRFVTPLLTNSL